MNVIFLDFDDYGIAIENINLKLVGKSTITNGIEFSVPNAKINVSGSGSTVFNYIGLSGIDIINTNDIDAVNKVKKYLFGNYVLSISNGKFLLFRKK